MSQETRHYIYNILVVTVPLLITLGILNEGIASDVLLIAAAVLAVPGFGVASSKSNPKNVDVVEKGKHVAPF